MGFLRRLEAFLERFLRSLAGPGVQRSVQPVEIGRQLTKAMLADRRVSTVNVYVPNEFTVYVSPQDWEKLKPLSLTIVSDMGDYLADRARRSGVSFVAPVHIEFAAEDSLSPGAVRVEAVFREREGDIQANIADNGQRHAMGGSKNSANGTQVYKLPPGAARDDARAELLAMNGSHRGQTWILSDEPVSIGRSREQHIQLGDPGVSRCHAVIRLSQGRYWIEDNASTNGTRVNNELIKNAVLSDGDIVQLGTIQLQFRMVK
ncbi:MAG: DUF3662 and FHA domain-containing protein [Firmicutes bacterium]|nr:DUF3662 and FHA domain-containing protein [Bacillota bacterium]